MKPIRLSPADPMRVKIDFVCRNANSEPPLDDIIGGLYFSHHRLMRTKDYIMGASQDAEAPIPTQAAALIILSPSPSTSLSGDERLGEALDVVEYHVDMFYVTVGRIRDLIKAATADSSVSRGFLDKADILLRRTKSLVDERNRRVHEVPPQLLMLVPSSSEEGMDAYLPGDVVSELSSRGEHDAIRRIVLEANIFVGGVLNEIDRVDRLLLDVLDG